MKIKLNTGSIAASLISPALLLMTSASALAESDRAYTSPIWYTP
jgi:hypothetical protein